jgi:hypothetical protein
VVPVGSAFHERLVLTVAVDEVIGVDGTRVLKRIHRE